ncbi:MAG: LLM class flavin-dependent oxidoreductase, partial [Phreatobacter sp.]
GVLADPAKVHYANYQGRWIKTRGPLSIPRSAQGRPVIMQAGSSDRGREFAARWAEVIFTIQRGRDEMREFYEDVKSRMAERGRAPSECAILPAVSVVLGETESIARERADYLNSLIDPELSVAASSSGLGADLTKLKSDTSLAALQGNQGMKGTEDILRQTMKADGLTLAQAAVKRGAGRELVGTATTIADWLQETFETGFCDGFVLAPTMFPGMFEQFCRSVVPELQRRGLFRTEYAGRTLRENLQS